MALTIRREGNRVVYKGGRRINPETQQPEKGEYSFFLEQAEKLYKLAEDIKEEIRIIEQQIHPNTETTVLQILQNLEREIEQTQNALRNCNPNNKQGIASIRRQISNLMQLHQGINERSGLFVLRNKLSQLLEKATNLIALDGVFDRSLRNMPEEKFIDRNV